MDRVYEGKTLSHGFLNVWKIFLGIHSLAKSLLSCLEGCGNKTIQFLDKMPKYVQGCAVL